MKNQKIWKINESRRNTSYEEVIMHQNSGPVYFIDEVNFFISQFKYLSLMHFIIIFFIYFLIHSLF